jgi:hypothetical protein
MIPVSKQFDSVISIISDYNIITLSFKELIKEAEDAFIIIYG